jgi:adenylate kinase
MLVKNGVFQYTTPMQEDFTALVSKITPWLGSGSINLFGLPFAGKDTHGRELAVLFGAPLLGGGDILRNSTIPPHVKQALDTGLLVPSEEFITIVTPFLGKSEFQDKPLILSSVGRWIGEERGVIGALNATYHPLKAVIYLSLDHSTARKRWQKSRKNMDRGERAEDAEHFLDIRFAEFEEKTIPVINYYREQNLLIEIDSTLPQREVLYHILKKLAQKATS